MSCEVLISAQGSHTFRTDDAAIVAIPGETDPELHVCGNFDNVKPARVDGLGTVLACVECQDAMSDEGRTVA